MPKNCIVPKQAEKLKKAFKSGEISLESLYNAKSSNERVKLLEKYIGESSEMVTAKLEKAMLSANQKLAIRNWIYKYIGEGKPLYKGISLEQSKKMAKDLSISELKNMSSRERVDELAKYVENPEELNTRFENLRTSGNLANWEQRTMGTKNLRENKRLKGALAKLEVLNDLGVLSPTALETFMQTFVESELGVDITLEESERLSKLVKTQTDLFDSLFESGDWTFNNTEEVQAYFNSVRKLREYADSLKPTTIQGELNKLIGYARSSILASPRILKNSALYQAIPTLERAIAKRIVSGNIGDKELDSSFVEKVQAKLSGSKPTKEMARFIAKQTSMAVKIYHKTGFDISRMETLEDGYTLFGGEKFKPIYGKKLSEAKGTKEKISAGLNNFAKFVNLAPKWFAGGTDMLSANVHRADTSILMSKEIASLEAKKNKLPNGVTENERAEQLLKDSYSFNPKDPKAEKIRAMGIMDAHMSNNTQPDGMADVVIKLRDAFVVKGIDFGKVLVPFAKIATSTLSKGIKTATGYGVAKSIYDINRATKLTDNNERSRKIYEATSNLVGYVGIIGAAMLLGAFLDEDDYVGTYDSISYAEYGLAKARGARPGYVRIGGKWIPIRYLPMINIPLSAIMTARQARARKSDPYFGYLRGVLGGVLETPGIKDISNVVENIKKGVKDNDLKESLDSLGLDSKSMLDWAKIRAIPSILSYDAYNMMFPKEAKYDFLGRELEAGVFKDDVSNRITLEFNRLNNAGFMPTISDPKEVPDEDKLNKYKQRYADKIEALLNKSRYWRISDEDKKDLIDAIRQKEILGKIKREK